MATTILPSLTDEPTLYPGCCFSLSRPLLGTIRALILQASPDIPSPSSSSSLSTGDVHQQKLDSEDDE